MATGRIRNVQHDRGFGFIEPDAEQGLTGDLFFHYTVVQDARFEDLLRDERVEFEVQPDPRDASRARATFVKVIGEAASAPAVPIEE